MDFVVLAAQAEKADIRQASHAVIDRTPAALGWGKSKQKRVTPRVQERGVTASKILDYQRRLLRKKALRSLFSQQLYGSGAQRGGLVAGHLLFTGSFEPH